MENQIRTLFIGEIQRNCDFALVAYGDMTKYMQPTDKETLDRFWLSAESFLIAVANISKILWPSRPNKCNKCNFQPDLPPEVSTRRLELRTILDVDNSSPINSRKFRNYFEHYDFQIEEWAKKSNKQVIFDSNIGTIGPIIRNLSNSISIRRNFNSSDMILYFVDESYNVNQVLKAVQDLLNKTKTVNL